MVVVRGGATRRKAERRRNFLVPQAFSSAVKTCPVKLFYLNHYFRSDNLELFILTKEIVVI